MSKKGHSCHRAIQKIHFEVLTRERKATGRPGSVGNGQGARSARNRVPVVLLEPLEKTVERLEHLLAVAEPLGRHSDVLVPGLQPGLVRQHELPRHVLKKKKETQGFSITTHKAP